MIDPQSSKTTGYHLFLEPTGGLAEELGKIIQTLAREYGGPAFTPHVTLLGRIPAGDDEDMIEKAKSLARALLPFALTLGRLEAQDPYFKALCIQIREKELMDQYHETAQNIFSMEDDREYAPHLSLLYGNYPAATKEETLANLSYPAGAAFQADRIHLYKTEGEVSEWVHLAEFELGK